MPDKEIMVEKTEQTNPKDVEETEDFTDLKKRNLLPDEE